MAALKSHRTVGQDFGNKVEYRRFVYDFAEDGGATGALDIMTAEDDLVMVHAHATVKTACTSDGSATLIWGIETVDTDEFCNTTQGAVANLTAGAVIVPPVVEGTPNVFALPQKLASGGKLIMTIGTAALTAGKIEFVVGLLKP